jgi:hypothetical protein
LKCDILVSRYAFTFNLYRYNSAFIGPDHYFVTCPDRAGRIQWYAFVKADKPDTPDVANPSEFLKQTFKVRELERVARFNFQ